MSAVQKAADAAQVVADLEERVRDGDTSVTPTMLDKARREASFAELHIDAERRGVEKERQAEHAAAVEAFMTDYEEYMTGTDHINLRNAYADVVGAVAHFHKVIEERIRAQSEIVRRAQALELNTSSAAPVGSDMDRWRAQRINPQTDFLELAVQEGRKGFPSRMGKPYAHPLHTPDRADDIRSLTSMDKRERGEVMRDRIVQEWLEPPTA